MHLDIAAQVMPPTCLGLLLLQHRHGGRRSGHLAAGGVVERSDCLNHAITPTRTRALRRRNARTQAMLRERTHADRHEGAFARCVCVCVSVCVSASVRLCVYLSVSVCVASKCVFRSVYECVCGCLLERLPSQPRHAHATRCSTILCARRRTS